MTVRSSIGSGALERNEDGNRLFVGLLDRRPLTRDSIQHLLRQATEQLEVIAVENASELADEVAGRGAKLDLIVLHLGRDRLNEPWVRQCLDTLRDRLTGTPVILLAEGDTQGLPDASATGVSGYIACRLSPASASLTQQEIKVLQLLKDGKQNKAIADELSMQEGTVKTHVRNILRKLNARNRTEVAILCNRILQEMKGPARG